MMQVKMSTMGQQVPTI